MTTIRLFLWGTLSGLSVLWFLAATLPAEPTFFTVRHQLIQYTGVLAISVMSIAMILATRPRWLEPWLHGLDKAYRLHKWLGISALGLATSHWLFVQGARWLVQLELIIKPRRAGQAGEAPLRGPVEQFLREFRDFAESIGEWAFYAAALLMVLALIRRFPYHHFLKTHKWLAAVYLVLVLHSVLLMQFSYWREPVGWLSAVLMLAGSISALLVLTNRVGRQHRVQGQITELHYHPEMNVLESHIQLDPGWPGHKAGQFAFVTFETDEGHHPFTIASAWQPDNRQILFITKALGDYTRQLPTRLQPGNPVTVEGPYGCFDFTDQHDTQIWISGGIGITPFLARLAELSHSRTAQTVVMFHATVGLTPEILAELKTTAAAAGVRLHVLVDQQDGRLDGDKVRALVPEWRSASVWFCGPTAFGEAIRTDLIASGLPPSAFHQELFSMR